MPDLELEPLDWLSGQLLNHSALWMLTESSDVVGILPKELGFGDNSEKVFEFVLARETTAEGISYDFGNDEWLRIKEVELSEPPTVETAVGDVTFDAADQSKIEEIDDALDAYRGFPPEEFSEIEPDDLPSRDDHL